MTVALHISYKDLCQINLKRLSLTIKTDNPKSESRAVLTFVKHIVGWKRSAHMKHILLKRYVIDLTVIKFIININTMQSVKDLQKHTSVKF